MSYSESRSVSGRDGVVLVFREFLLQLLGEVSQHHLVRIFSADRTTLYATLSTISAERPKPADHLAFTFAERGSAQPQAIVTWFYPGDTTGHEFLYPTQLQKELAKDKHDTITTGN